MFGGLFVIVTVVGGIQPEIYTIYKIDKPYRVVIAPCDLLMLAFFICLFDHFVPPTVGRKERDPSAGLDRSPKGK